MQLRDFIQELGPFTVLQELGKIKDDLSPLKKDLMDLLPIDPNFMKTEKNDLTKSVLKTITVDRNISAKSQIILAGSDLVMLEALAGIQKDLSVIVAVNDGISSISLERIMANIPKGIDCSVFPLPLIPYNLSPTAALLITSGFYAGGSLALIPEATRKILNFYRGFFFGETIFINPFPYPVSTRPDGWVTVTLSEYFTEFVDIPESEYEYYRGAKS